MIGTALGTGRALLLTAVLFAYCALFPQGPMTDYVQQSGLYREVAAQVIRPATGNLIEKQLPVFAQAMSSELDQLWQKRYDVIDAELPEDIVQAAISVTEGKSGDEEKARALYDWVGSRITYDDDKVRAYEEQGDWREQDPEHTFTTRKGVCIDYARLYAAMARAVDLDVRVVTGLGYEGAGVMDRTLGMKSISAGSNDGCHWIQPGQNRAIGSILPALAKRIYGKEE